MRKNLVPILTLVLLTPALMAPDCKTLAEVDAGVDDVVYGCGLAFADTFAANDGCFLTQDTASCKQAAALGFYNKIRTRNGKNAFLAVMDCLCNACSPVDGPSVCLFGYVPESARVRVLDVFHSQCVGVSVWNGCSSIIQGDCYGDGGAQPQGQGPMSGEDPDSPEASGPETE